MCHHQCVLLTNSFNIFVICLKIIQLDTFDLMNILLFIDLKPLHVIFSCDKPIYACGKTLCHNTDTLHLSS